MLAYVKEKADAEHESTLEKVSFIEAVNGPGDDRPDTLHCEITVEGKVYMLMNTYNDVKEAVRSALHPPGGTE